MKALVLDSASSPITSPIGPPAVAATDDGRLAPNWPPASGCAKRQTCSLGCRLCRSEVAALAVGHVVPRPSPLRGS